MEQKSFVELREKNRSPVWWALHLQIVPAIWIKYSTLNDGDIVNDAFLINVALKEGTIFSSFHITVFTIFSSLFPGNK